MARSRPQIQPERLGRSLRAHDVLMPEPEAPAPVPAEVKAARLQREPTTVRFTKATLKELARARSHFLLEQDLKVTQSDIIEAAVLKALGDLDSLEELLRQGQE